MVDETPSDKPQGATICALAVCALLIRVALVVATADSLDADPDAYRGIAENLRQHGVYGSDSFPTAFRPPLYPVLLAALAVNGKITPLAVGGLHVMMGVATVVLSYLLARRWQLGRWQMGRWQMGRWQMGRWQMGRWQMGRWSFVAAALVAIDPILLNQSSLVMTETLAALLATGGLFVLCWWNERPSLYRALLAGVVLGLGCLCRPTFIPWLGLSALAMVFLQRKPPSRNSIGMPAALLLSAAMVVSPWVLRNYAVFGVPKATTTHGGYTVLLGNNPSFYRYLREAPRGTTWDSTELAQAWELRRFSISPQDAMWNFSGTPSGVPRTNPVNRSEFEDDAFAYSLARRYIGDEPGMFAYSCLVRVSRLWQLTPYRTSRSESTIRVLARVVTGCWYAVLFVLAIVALLAQRSEALRSPLVWGLLLCLSFTAVHALYWSNMRMRAPLMPFVCLLAAHGAARIAGRGRDRKP